MEGISPNSSTKSKRKQHQPNSSFKDPEFYIPYTQSDTHTEKGYAITRGTTFLEKAQTSTLDVLGDDLLDTQHSRSNPLKWDRKKKKYVREDTRNGSLRNEAGVLIKSSYKTNK
jgi:ATP-dependent RNA helicase DDX54/DBP10